MLLLRERHSSPGSETQRSAIHVQTEVDGSFNWRHRLAVLEVEAGAAGCSACPCTRGRVGSATSSSASAVAPTPAAILSLRISSDLIKISTFTGKLGWKFAQVFKSHGDNGMVSRFSEFMCLRQTLDCIFLPDKSNPFCFPTKASLLMRP